MENQSYTRAPVAKAWRVLKYTSHMTPDRNFTSVTTEEEKKTDGLLIDGTFTPLSLHSLQKGRQK